MRRSLVRVVGIVGFMVLALVVANVLGDAFGLARFAGFRQGLVAVATVAAVAACSGAIMEKTRRAAAVGAIAAATCAFMLMRLPLPWIDLGPFGAGPLGATAVVLLPLAQLAAMFAVKRWSR